MRKGGENIGDRIKRRASLDAGTSHMPALSNVHSCSHCDKNPIKASIARNNWSMPDFVVYNKIIEKVNEINLHVACPWCRSASSSVLSTSTPRTRKHTHSPSTTMRDVGLLLHIWHIISITSLRSCCYSCNIST